MSRKALNKTNLVDLGADALADLLLEAVKGDAARQRRVRLALAADQGPQDAAADVRKRFAGIRRARSFLSSQAQRKLAKELADLIGLVETQVAPAAPDTAFDLLWSLLQLAPAIHLRTDDSNGTIGGVMDEAMQAIGRIAPQLSSDQEALAEQIFDALQDNGYGEFDGAVMALAEALGDAGLHRLQVLAEQAQAAALTESDLARYVFVRDPERQAALAREDRDRTAGMVLQDVADLKGDVDTWLARYTPEQLTFHTIAPDAAARLLNAGRAEDALGIVANALNRAEERGTSMDMRDLDDAHFACLAALGRDDDLQRALWRRFERHLCPDALRRHLTRLPDFEDMEAEDRARSVVLDHPSIERALIFCLSWPDPALAARLVLTHVDRIDGDAYEILTPAAEALQAEHPLAAVLLWRAMIRFALENARAKRYRHAARHLASCAAVEAAIADHAGHPDHAGFVEALRRDHGRKAAFWSRAGQ